MAKTTRKLYALIRQYGLKRCLFRLQHDLKRRGGLLKRKFPTWNWEDRPLSYWLGKGAPSDPAGYRAFRERTEARFFFAPGQPPRPPSAWLSQGLTDAQRLLAGKIRYFSRIEGKIGYPDAEWFVNPFTGQTDPPLEHWCDLSDFALLRGDIKYLWEPSRFGWAFALSRAYAAGGNEQYPQAFWRLFESWLEANPPQMGVNWQCGQEAAIRLMACVFAAHVFWASPHTTDERIVRLAVFLAASAERIAANINYARAQMGNHATSEAAGLYTVGVLFPEIARARSWRELGRQVLEDEARQHNWPDGSYTQHSMNYQRLMLHAYIWCMRLGELNGEEFSDRTRDRLARSYQFLYQLQDAGTGRLPNYGPNDGALILPLNSCDYLNYQPIIGAMHFLFRRERLYEDGPWAEDLLWLFGPGALAAPLASLPRVSSGFRHGGYYTLRDRHTWAMTRCHTYRNRPNQADMLHLDLWWRGVNVLRDSGSFSYYDPEGNWNQYFPATAAHNTVQVAGVDQMVKGPRFRWFSLARSRLVGRARQGEVELWQGEHYGYRRLPCRATHRRTICRMGDAYWLIVDDVLGRGEEDVRLFWHLADLPYRIEENAVTLSHDAGEVTLFVASGPGAMALRVERGLDGRERMGWQSLYYGERSPAPTLCAAVHARLPVRFVTLVSLGRAGKIAECVPESAVAWRESAGPEMRVELFGPEDGERVIRSIRLDPENDWRVPYPLPRE